MTSERPDMSTIIRLEGWVTLSEAAERLGFSKQGLHRLIFESPSPPFDPATDIRGVGEKPLIVLREERVAELEARRVNPDTYRHGLAKLA